ncbi:MAG: Lipid biosynthesis lauroyl acyltransferase [Pseudomonadota bacterium]
MLNIGLRLVVSVFAVLSYLPLSSRRDLARLLGAIVWLIASRRRQIAITNLRLAFPEWDEQQVKQTAQAHFFCYARAFLDRFVIWRASALQCREMVALEGRENLSPPGGGPLIILAPHFLGLDVGGVRIQLEAQIVSMYSRQMNSFLDNLVLSGRARFNDPILIQRNEGMLRLAKLVKKGIPAYFLPDMDLGSRDAVFADFMGQKAATVTSLVRLAQLTQATVVPMVTWMEETGYRARLYPGWRHPKDEDLLVGVQRMNDFIAERVREAPEQYLWTHRRFKTRPPGEPSVYQ